MDISIELPAGRAVNRKASSGGSYPIGYHLGADATADFSTKVSRNAYERKMMFSVYELK